MNPKFMVVDDDEDTLKLIGDVLESLGCEVDRQLRGESALEILTNPEKASQFDAIFLDIMMPGLSGLAVLERLRMMSHTREMPVILLTAKGTEEEVVQGYQLGASYYIPKPFTTSQIVYGLDLVLGSQNSTEEEAPAEAPKQVPVHKIDFNPDALDSEQSAGVMIPPQTNIPTRKS